MEKQLRQPYVINISNTTNEAINFVNLFFSASTLNEKFNSEGNLEKNGLVISSLKNVSYKQILEHFFLNKVRIGLTTITSENEKNNRNYIKYKFKGTNGHSFSKTLIFLSENFSTDSQFFNEYVLDGFVALKLNCIEANSKLTLRFFPLSEEVFSYSLAVENSIDKLVNRDF
jgi:hypothetical protein